MHENIIATSHEPAAHLRQLLLRSQRNMHQQPQPLKKKITPLDYSPPELSLFKQRVQSNCNDYAHHYEKIWRYRCIFFALSFIFVSLALFTFAHHLTFSQALLDNFRHIVKNSLGLLEIALAISSSAIGLSLCVMREATAALVFKNKRHAAQIYARRCIARGLSRLIAIDWHTPRSQPIKRAYQQLLMQIDMRRHETLTLLHDIQNADNLTAEEQERLYNQALAELECSLRHLVYHFDMTPYP
jgi:hypothetical protein